MSTLSIPFGSLQVQWVQTRFTVVIDDDIIFTRNTRLEHLIEVLKQNPSVGLVGGTYEVCWRFHCCHHFFSFSRQFCFFRPMVPKSDHRALMASISLSKKLTLRGTRPRKNALRTTQLRTGLKLSLIGHSVSVTCTRRLVTTKPTKLMQLRGLLHGLYLGYCRKVDVTHNFFAARTSVLRFVA